MGESDKVWVLVLRISGGGGLGQGATRAGGSLFVSPSPARISGFLGPDFGPSPQAEGNGGPAHL